MTLDRARDKLVTGPEFAQQRGAHAVGLGTPGRRVLPRLLGEYRELVELQHEEGGEVGRLDHPRIIEDRGVMPPRVVTVFVERYGAARRTSMIAPVPRPVGEARADVRTNLGYDA